MSDIPVRIVDLPPVRVASALGFGPSPEAESMALLRAYLIRQGLLDRLDRHRFYGFNNPNPSAGSPNYGYEQWVTVDADASGSEEVTVKDFAGGRFAVMHIEGLPSPEKWQLLVAWVENSDYRMAPGECLEECTRPELLLAEGGPDIDRIAFDLLLPVHR